MRIFFLDDITEKRRLTILGTFQKRCPGIKSPEKDELIILCGTKSPLGPKSQADILEKKLMNRKKIMELLKN